jgi:hypothetical protein
VKEKNNPLRTPRGIKLKLIFNGNRTKSVDMIRVAQDRSQWQVPVNTGMEVCDWVTYYWFIKKIPDG